MRALLLAGPTQPWTSRQRQASGFGRQVRRPRAARARATGRRVEKMGTAERYARVDACGLKPAACGRPAGPEHAHAETAVFSPSSI
jgi:hypothetical protein